MSYFSALRDRSHEAHFWRWINISWVFGILAAFPALTLAWQYDGIAPLVFVAIPPMLAHLYAFGSNLDVLRSLENAHRLGPAMTVASYFGASVICMFLMPPSEALMMPFVGVFMTILTMGIFFTGLAPLLAFWVTKYVLARGVTRQRVIWCYVILVTAWLMAGMTGHILGNA